MDMKLSMLLGLRIEEIGNFIEKSNIDKLKPTCPKEIIFQFSSNSVENWKIFERETNLFRVLDKPISSLNNTTIFFKSSNQIRLKIIDDLLFFFLNASIGCSYFF